MTMDLDDLERRYRDWPEVKALIAELREAREALDCAKGLIPLGRQAATFSGEPAVAAYVIHAERRIDAALGGEGGK